MPCTDCPGNGEGTIPGVVQNRADKALRDAVREARCGCGRTADALRTRPRASRPPLGERTASRLSRHPPLTGPRPELLPSLAAAEYRRTVATASRSPPRLRLALQPQFPPGAVSFPAPAITASPAPSSRNKWRRAAGAAILAGRPRASRSHVTTRLLKGQRRRAPTAPQRGPLSAEELLQRSWRWRAPAARRWL